MVVSFEMRLWRVSFFFYEMTMSVRFCLSYDPLKWDFITFKMKFILIRKDIVDMDVVNDAAYTRCYYTYGHMIFMTRYPLNNSNFI